MYKTAAELLADFPSDPAGRRAAAAAACRSAIDAASQLVKDAGDTGLTASAQREYDKHVRNADELEDLKERSLNEVIERLARPIQVEPNAHRGDRAPAAASEARMNRVLPSGRSFSDLPGLGGGSEEEAGQWLLDVAESKVRVEPRAMGESVGAAGGFAVPAPVSGVILDKVRAAIQVANAGATIVPMDSKTLQISKVETDPEALWKAENVAVPERDMTLGAVTLNAKTLSFISRVSRELLEDAANVSTALTNAVAAAFALAIDKAALYGPGGDAPTGLRSAAGLEVVSLGANGLAPGNWRFIGQAIGRVRQRNYPVTGILLSPRTEADVNNLVKADGSPIEASDYVKAVPRYETNQVPNNLTLGTGTNLSELIAGDFSRLVLGVRTTFSILPLSERYAEFGQVAFMGWARVDSVVTRVDAFTVTNGIAAVA